MIAIPDELRVRLQAHGQDHVVAFWHQISDTERQRLIEQLRMIDMEQLRALFAMRDQGFAVPTEDRVAPIPVAALDPADTETKLKGEAALRHGRVAVLMVAGGQGSRLGFEHPKGMYPIGPVSNKSLFQIHSEKVLALSRRFGASIRFLILTSPATHDETESYFAEHRYFGLPRSEVHFFCQGTMPALDLSSGKLLMEGPGQLFTSPNGHGGSLTALADSGLLSQLRERGVQQVFYFQVDNPLIKVADPHFLGHHILQNAEASCKIVPKEGPADKLGNMVLVDGRCSMIEYSDLPENLGKQTDASGKLRIWAGSPAIHIFSVDFLSRVTQGSLRIPFHVARKKVPYVDSVGRRLQPERENALKFEMFIFDVLPMADRWAIVETSRREEFMPLKNASGPDSPETVRQAISNLAGDWLQAAGAEVSRKANGDVAVPLEISPLHALDGQELAAKVSKGMKADKALYLS